MGPPPDLHKQAKDYELQLPYQMIEHGAGRLASLIGSASLT